MEKCDAGRLSNLPAILFIGLLSSLLVREISTLKLTPGIIEDYLSGLSPSTLFSVQLTQKL